MVAEFILNNNSESDSGDSNNLGDFKRLKGVRRLKEISRDSGE